LGSVFNAASPEGGVVPEPVDWNKAIIEDFRNNGGKVGGQFEGSNLLLLHHTGARTGTERVNPLAYQPLENGFAVFASKGGAPTNPDWYHNLVAHPDVSVEVGTDVVDVRARVAVGEERDAIWERQKRTWPGFADYEKMTTRRIPVVVLERVG
jgi:deazaflavin-dependent oxidoreductase (nitroreductase family)